MRISYRAGASSIVHLFGTAQSDRIVLQDFTPLADSLEWELGARYFARRGSDAFFTERVPVPFVVNNNGLHSRHAAEVLFSALTFDETPVEQIIVLELGIGLGLFARYFLDAFRDLCIARGADYYDRITYVAADYSERMLLDAVRRGTFQNHPGRYVLRVIDALDPQTAILCDPLLQGATDRPLSAVFLNYVLDCLPTTVLCAGPELTVGAPCSTVYAHGSLHQLCVRTCLARGVDLREYTEYTCTDLVHLAGSANPAERESLLDLFGLFASEYDYRPVRCEDLPYSALIADAVPNREGLMVHCYGAIASLEKILALLHARGIILVNDYPGLEGFESGAQFEHQRYGNGVFVGINFDLLKRYFTDWSCAAGSEFLGSVDWVEPEQSGSQICSRLLGRNINSEVAATFRRCFDGSISLVQDRSAESARVFAEQGRFESAATAYRTALESAPWDWLMINEGANFLTFGLGAAQTGLELARAGLELNPCCSSDLWNSYGDALFALGLVARARSAYKRALDICADDVQARYNLAWVFLHFKEHGEALRVIGEALARDWRGTFRDRLLQKQAEIMADLSRRTQQETRTLLNRVSLYPRSSGNHVTEAQVRNKGHDMRRGVDLM
ncbi:tetratricopeptide repeat protein : Uncharacterized protein OS=Delftia acidovorans CCUG 274B GN=HMPREF9701_05386 PE=4 SV=1: TPR_16 [Gemmata massiliana]|uniref:Uncharacterized protein n=1 Tax=Gemmata massiliana TaxID=1210884 RepID=A0A6P2CRV0_9BACT|nr:tetratricopeptide repeat protein [Gemmata massiliana]VTR91661.1 tetratricopeptide repeat protein : Uncharacterized protein OS=Delftia acidovorans CCUG 274B GN=HMPREF9701_05386 PE=4 SV=1: TPR_16 [Gemmata massiliana]